MSEWQPIDTAPKDGTAILVGRFTGNPQASHEGVCAVDWWRSITDRSGFVGFGQFNPSYFPATHWMPLPPPPTGGTP